MTKNEETVETTTEEETQEETTEETTESTEEESTEETTEGTEEESGGENIDYKAELQKLRKEVAGDAYKYRKGRREETVEAEEDEEDKPITAKQLKEVLSDNTAQTVSRIKKEQIETEVHNRARNGDEANLVLHHLETTLKGGTGNTNDDIDNAFALANKGRMKEVVSEVNRAIDSSKRKGKGDVQSRKTSKKEEDKAPTLSPKDQAMVERYKLVWNPKEKKHVSQEEAKKLGLIK